MKKNRRRGGWVQSVPKAILNATAVTVCLMLIALGSRAAGVSGKAAVINLNVRDVTIVEIFQQIEESNGIGFFFKNDQMDLKKTYSVNFQNSSLEDVLKRLLGGDYRYRFVGKNVVISRSKFSGSTSAGNGVVISDGVVRGVVTDADGVPVPGASVMIKGTTTGTVTDVNGNYSLQGVEASATLVFSFIGMKTSEVLYKGQKVVNVKLAAATIGIGEVVAVGYGVQKKEDVTGAVASLSVNTLQSKPVTQLSSALQGSASGVTIIQSSGQPGNDGGSINIRGVGSLSTTDEYGNTINKNQPLVLVDGMEYNIDDVDASDIASISILKDAAASSIYGVRAANGVILIKTKRGAKGATKVSYNGYFGVQSPTELPNFLGAQDYMKLVNLMSENSGGSPKFTDTDIAAYNNPDRNTDQYPDVNWMDEVLQGSGFQQEHSVAVTSGNEKSQMRFSANYFDQKGLVKKTDFQRLTLRLNTDVELTKKLKFSTDISAKIADRTEPQGTGGGMWFQFSQAYQANPTLPVRYSDGTWGIARGDGNPVRLQDEGGKYDYQDNLFSGNFKLDYKPVKGLTISGIANIGYTTTFNYLTDKALTYTDFSTGDETVKGIDDVSNYVYKTWHKNLQALIRYEKTISDHQFHLLAGIQRVEDKTNYLYAYRDGGSLDDLNEVSAGDASSAKNDGYEYATALLSYFGRLNYSYKDKYLLEANLRTDGSSRFANGNRWGVFPSFSLGWRISQEAFLQNIDFLKEFKLRGSWGELGNQEIGRYPYQSLMVLGYNYPLGETLSSGARAISASNQNISWETTEMTDFGFDAMLFQGKADMTFDYYIKKTKDILLDLDIPATVGVDAPYQNAGTVQNNGWEFSIGYKGKIGHEFTYGVHGNLSNVKNKIVDLHDTYMINASASNLNVTIDKEGQPIDAFYGYKAQGLFQSADAVVAHATQSSSTGAGDLVYKDANGDGTVDSNDRKVIGSDIPHYTYGMNLDGSYKNFDFTVFFQGVGKIDVNTLQANRAPISQDGNFKKMHLDSWTPENTNARFPRLTTSSINYVMSSYWIKSGAYLRLKNIEIGYTLPRPFLHSIGFSKCRFYVNGQNLLTFSGLTKDGIDPENPQDARYYPQVKTYTVGLNVNF